MSIGEVLAHLRVDFPDTTISKLRFLEAEGLVEPCRTPSGYRKYSAEDVARLRYVLTAQRDQYLPLRVIREHLAALDEGEEPDGSLRLRASLVSVDHREAGRSDSHSRISRVDVVTRAGITEDLLGELERHGLICPTSAGWYDADAVEIAIAAGRLAEYGVEPRHLRAYKATADREIGLFEQLVAPMVRQPGPAARARAAETLRELAVLTQRVHAALVRSGLRQTLGR